MPSLRISVFVTRESQANSITRKQAHEKSVSESSSNATLVSGLNDLLEKTSPRFSISFLGNQRPSISEVVEDFMERTVSEQWWQC